MRPPHTTNQQLRWPRRQVLAPTTATGKYLSEVRWNRYNKRAARACQRLGLHPRPIAERRGKHYGTKKEGP